jgi:long-chain fatty acid transport protein
MKNGRRTQAALGALAILSMSSVASASPFEVYGASPRAAGMGNAMTAEANGVDALFYNPAALSRARNGAVFGVLVGVDQTAIRLKARPSGYDIPDLGGSSPALPSSATLRPRVDTEGLGTLTTVTIGGTTDLGSQRLRVAGMATFPVQGAGGNESYFVDERERVFGNQLRWEVIGARARRFDIELGGSYQVLDSLSIGLGAQLLPSVRVRNDVWIPSPSDQANVDINLRQEQTFSAGFTAGVLWSVSDVLRLGASYRHRVEFTIEGENALQILGLDTADGEYPVMQTLDFVTTGSPSSASFGAALDSGNFTFALDMRWTQWSGYRNTQGEAAGFESTFSPRVGLEYHASEETDVRLGVAWEPSPVPDQVGRTNYVDNDRLILSFGASHGFETFGRAFRVNWFAQFHALTARDTDKQLALAWPVCAPGVTGLCDELPDDLRDVRSGRGFPEAEGLQTGNPGFPGFVSGGWMAAIGGEITWFF